VSRRSEALEAPCERLARECGEAGHSIYAARIRELLPADVSTDDHRELLASVLAELATDAMIPDPIRDVALHLADVAVEPAPFIGRCGTVFVAWAGFHLIRPGQPPPTYTDYWDQYPDGDYAFLEQGPDTPDLSEVLRWAQARSDRIIVRPEFDPLNEYWAGTPAEHPPQLLPLPRRNQ
jgi:hypothetical protein